MVSWIVSVGLVADLAGYVPRLAGGFSKSERAAGFAG